MYYYFFNSKIVKFILIKILFLLIINYLQNDLNIFSILLAAKLIKYKSKYIIYFNFVFLEK